MAMFSARFTDTDLRAVVLIAGNDPATVAAAMKTYAPDHVTDATYTETPGSKLVIQPGGDEVTHYVLPRLAVIGMISGALVEVVSLGTIQGTGLLAGVWAALASRYTLKYFPF